MKLLNRSKELFDKENEELSDDTGLVEEEERPHLELASELPGM